MIVKYLSIAENILPKFLNTQNILSVPSGTLPRSSVLWLLYLRRQLKMKNAKGPFRENEVIPWYSLPYSALLLFISQLYFITIHAKKIVIMVLKFSSLSFNSFLSDLFLFYFSLFYEFFKFFLLSSFSIIFLDSCLVQRVVCPYTDCKRRVVFCLNMTQAGLMQDIRER